MTDKKRLTAADFDPKVMRLFDQYVHGAIDRRGFLTGAGQMAISAAAATGLLAALCAVELHRVCTRRTVSTGRLSRG